jgi:hypothetical protein
MTAGGDVRRRPSMGVAVDGWRGTGKINNNRELDAAWFLSEAHSSRVSGMTLPHDNSKSQPAPDQ